MFWPKNKDIIHQENTAWEKSSLYDSLNGYMSCLYVTSSHNVVASAVCHWDFMPCNSEFTQRCCSVVYCSRMNHLHNTGRRNLLTMAIMLKMMMGMIIKSLMCSCSFILRRILLWYSAMGFNGQFLKRCTFSFESKKDLSEMSGHWITFFLCSVLREQLSRRTIYSESEHQSNDSEASDRKRLPFLSRRIFLRNLVHSDFILTKTDRINFPFG